jgi:hypothetical protein
MLMGAQTIRVDGPAVKRAESNQLASASNSAEPMLESREHVPRRRGAAFVADRINGRNHANEADARRMRCRTRAAGVANLSGTAIASRQCVPEVVMSLVRLLGFSTLGCGCVVGRYRDVATSREIAYVEEKGADCHQQAHRRNHTISAPRRDPVVIARAS